MRKAFIYLYNAWCLFWFVAWFLVLFPFTYICLQRKQWHKYAHQLNYFWSRLLFPMIFMPIDIEFEAKPDPKQTYVFVANHFSYLDIPMATRVISNYFAFVGKSSVKNVPLFGYMFAKLHLPVDRGDKNSRTKSLVRAMKTLKEGRSIFIMPEGGIISKHIPKMHQPFKDGAFAMAIEAQVPIVPISFLNLYEIMPDTLLNWGRVKVIVHKPIETIGKTKTDIEALKQEVYQVIQGALDGRK